MTLKEILRLSRKRTYSEISKLIENVKTVKINFGSILEENMNARKYFMVIKQMLKYIDETNLLDFLLQSDFSLTVMTALYYSKLFVEEKSIYHLCLRLKRSFSGHNVISTLLKNSYYRKYIIKREKLAVQTGFSDAGRYLGQSTVLSIENLQRKIAKLLR